MRTWRGRLAAVGALLLLIGFAASIAGQKVPTSADALYQQALLKKDGDGDLDVAIKLFTRILTEFPKERKIAGLAQLQIGICYEKLGLAKAEEAYRKVIADFGDQVEAVKAAKERLNALSSAIGTRLVDRSVVFRQLSIPEGYISPNGRCLAYATDNMDGIVFYDIESGKDHSIKLTPSDDGTCCGMVLGWTPSSKSVLVEMFNNRGTRLKLVDVGPGSVKDIAPLEGLLVMASGGFSPDERFLYVLVRSTDWSFHAVGRVSLGDGQYSEILNLGPTRAGSLGISADGKQLALTIFPRNDLLDSDINILSTEGGEMKPLVAGPSADKFMGWMPDNRGILFSSTRGGEQALWALPVTGGRPSGDIVLVRPVRGFASPSGFTNDGAFYYTEWLRGQDVNILPIDFERGTRAGEPRKLESVYDGRTRTPLWSPDGTSLAYIFATTQESDPFCRHILKIYSMATGKTKDILLEFKQSQYLFASGWTSDGRSVILRGDLNGQVGLWQIDVATGEPKLIHESSRAVAWADDGKVVFESRRSAGDIEKQVFWIIRKDLRSGQDLEIFRGQPGWSLSWMMASPDGKYFSFRIIDDPGSRRPHTFAIFPEGGGSEVARIQDQTWGDDWSPLLFWGPRNKGGLVILLRKGQEGERSELRYYPLGSKTPARKLEFGEKVVWGELAFSPDGKFLAFTSDIKSETLFWSVENYLPQKK